MMNSSRGASDSLRGRILLPCQKCGQTFNEKIFQYHQTNCLGPGITRRASHQPQTGQPPPPRLVDRSCTTILPAPIPINQATESSSNGGQSNKKSGLFFVPIVDPIGGLSTSKHNLISSNKKLGDSNLPNQAEKRNSQSDEGKTSKTKGIEQSVPSPRSQDARPLFVSSQVCGKRITKNSLPIHEPQCAKLTRRQEERAEKNNRAARRVWPVQSHTYFNKSKSTSSTAKDSIQNR